MKHLHFLAALILIGSVVAQAQVKTVLINGLWCKLYQNKKVAEIVAAPTYRNVVITSTGKPKKKVVIPKIVYDYDVMGNGKTAYSVIGIGEAAFKNQENLTEIELPENILIIDDFAFGGCTKLQKITLPSNLLYLGEGAFTSCESLQNIVILDSLKQIGSGAFDGCKNLKSVAWNAIHCDLMPSLIDTTIVSPFVNCPKLSLFTFGEKVEFIPPALLYRNQAVKEISIPQTVTEIGGYAFAYCKKLRLVRFKNSLGTRANQETWFAGCHADIESVLMPGESVSIY